MTFGRDSVSVVIPFYDSMGTIERALESVARQTVLPSEIIIVDDASAPQEHRALEEVLKRAWGTPVRLLTLPENVGPATARNVGWDAASGEWIGLLDADDAWHERHLELQLDAAGSGTIMVGSASTLATSAEWMQLPVADNPSVDRVSLRDLLVHNIFSTSGVLIRRITPARFTPGRRYAEDHELWMRLAAEGRVLKIRSPLVAHFKEAVGAGGLSGRVGPMIRGEYGTYALLLRDGVLTRTEFVLGITILSIRVVRRLVLLEYRSMMRRGPL